MSEKAKTNGQNKISRRRFLMRAGEAVGASALACG